MANYIEQYQYQPINPANTNIDQIARTYQMKMQYWEQGASQVKSAYQNYLGLSLTRDDNQQALSGYMKGAKQDIQRLSQTDLSSGDNVAKALGVFDGLTNGRTEMSKNIMGDHALTSKLSDAISFGESQAKIDGGKNYGANNVQYLRNKLTDFRNDQNAGSWQDYMATGTEYTPYVDVTKEISDNMKNYKASEYLQQYADSNGYLHTIETNIADRKNPFQGVSNDVKRYILGTLSDKAKRQLQIDGAVEFYGNENVLKASYVSDYANTLASHNEQLKKNNFLLQTATADKAKQLHAENEALNSEIAQGSAILQNLTNDDYIRKNRDVLAGSAKLNQFVNAAATGYARVISKDKVSPDYTYLGKMKVAADLKINADNISSKEKIAQLDADTKLSVARISNSDKTTTTTTLDNPVNDPNSTAVSFPIKDGSTLKELTNPIDDEKTKLLSATNSFVSDLTVGDKAAYNALPDDDKVTYIKTHFQDKMNKFNEVNTQIDQEEVAAKAANQFYDRNLRAKQLYEKNNLVKYKGLHDQLEEYDHAKNAYDAVVTQRTEDIFNHIPNTVHLDARNDPGGVAAFVGNLSDNSSGIALTKQQYKSVLDGTSPHLHIYYRYVKNAHPDLSDQTGGIDAKELTGEQKKAVMQEFRKRMEAKDYNPDSNYTILADIMDKHGIKLENPYDRDPSHAQAGLDDGQILVGITGNDGKVVPLDLTDSKNGLHSEYGNAYKSKYKPTEDQARTVQAFQIKDKGQIEKLDKDHNGGLKDKDKKYRAFYRDQDGHVFGEKLQDDGTGNMVYGIDREHILETNSNYAFDPNVGLDSKFANAKVAVEAATYANNYTSPYVYQGIFTSPKNSSFRIKYERKPDEGSPTYTVYKYDPKDSDRVASGDLKDFVQYTTLQSMQQVQNLINSQ